MELSVHGLIWLHYDIHDQGKAHELRLMSRHVSPHAIVGGGEKEIALNNIHGVATLNEEGILQNVTCRVISKQVQHKHVLVVIHSPEAAHENVHSLR